MRQHRWKPPIGFRILRGMRRVFGIAFAALLPACAALNPQPTSLKQRLAAFPTEGLPIKRPVRVYWNDHQVPFIVAQEDEDLAFALGLVHAHLRLGQLSILKRISQGRLSEMAGPFATDIDHALRILDYGYAAPRVVAGWPDETRGWMSAFVDGLNHYQNTAQRLPPEFALLGIEPEPWRPEDLVTIGRLAGTDVNWLTYFPLLKLRDQPDWTAVWRRALASGGALPAEMAGDAGQDGDLALLSNMLSGLSRSGSNSVVVAPGRSASGAPLIANDPHLGITLPNYWLLVGMKSPSYHAVGMMVPGLPFMALGRNPVMAWGGTNMRAASSDLYDVADEPEEAIESAERRLGTRFWFDRTRQTRRTRLGPVVSDSPLINGRPGEVLALRWVGHEPTDEITAFLKASRATTPDEFRAAFADYGVSAQNMLFADVNGNIGTVLAVRQPRRAYDVPDDLVLDADDADSAWRGFDTALDLPMRLNPEQGYLVSANNRPRHIDRVLGYFYTPDERVERLAALVSDGDSVAVADLETLQRDVTAPFAKRLAHGLARLVDDAGLGDRQGAFATRLRAWNGRYDVASTGAVAFETLLYHVAHGLYGSDDGETDRSALYGRWGFLTEFLLRDLERLPEAERRALLVAALEQAAEDGADYDNWGDMHRLEVGHILKNLPVFGDLFILDNVPIGGSRETPLKTSHGLVKGRHNTSFGAQARHISDLGDPDANYFALLGGQDGWLGSTTFADQLPLWLDGRYIRLPLSPDTAAGEFDHHMTLRSDGPS